MESPGVTLKMFIILFVSAPVKSYVNIIHCPSRH